MFELPRVSQESKSSVLPDIEVYRHEDLALALEGKGEREREYAETLRRIVTNKENFIDKGGAGQVFVTGEQKGICIKVMPDRHGHPEAGRYDLGNSITQEAHFLGSVSHFEVAGVRAPEFVESLPGRQYGFLIMERLDAVNLRHVLNGLVSLPDTFNFEDFFSSLQSYIGELHDQKRIVHGDLEARNIMIDLNSGKPRVIDFGRSIHIPQGSSKKEIQRLESSDFEVLERVETEVKALIDKIKK